MSEEPDQGTVLRVAEELYGLPLAEFTPARDARARELKGTPEGPVVKRLRKPSTAAWVVDLLVRHETEQVDQILIVGEALREASAGMDAGQLRQLTRQRRQLTAAVTTRARALAREHGLRVTPAVADQVEATLTAAMIDEGAAGAVRSGLLVSTLAATGVDAVEVTAAVALPGALGHVAAPVRPDPPSLHAVPDAPADAGPDQAEVEAARAELADAEQALAGAEEERTSAVARVEEVQAEHLQVQSELDELRRRLVALEADAEQVGARLTEAESARTEADTAHRSATARHRRAAADLDTLLG
ncbi:hypothetical protein [Nocardioides insulae]|uniref:hypothetical protein n=1 Tax=Nocardioides insulae TaxID=394734 RepID=UPI00040C5208|nr:hypothetical protein [Nocardioides insulae]